MGPVSAGRARRSGLLRVLCVRPLPTVVDLADTTINTGIPAAAAEMGQAAGPGEGHFLSIIGFAMAHQSPEFIRILEGTRVPTSSGKKEFVRSITQGVGKCECLLDRRGQSPDLRVMVVIGRLLVRALDIPPPGTARTTPLG